jgi:hypothetical protein
MNMMNQIHQENEHLILMWVSGYAGIQDNETADQHAKSALKGEIDWTHKTIPNDWKNWIKKGNMLEDKQNGHHRKTRW